MLDLEPIKTRLAAVTPGPWGIVNNQGELPDGGWNVIATTPLGSASLTVARQAYRGDATMIAHAPADLAALVAEVERLRSALVCERCEGDGTIGWPDQAELCPVCGPTRREIPGHWMHGIPG